MFVLVFLCFGNSKLFIEIFLDETVFQLLLCFQIINILTQILPADPANFVPSNQNIYHYLLIKLFEIKSLPYFNS